MHRAKENFVITIDGPAGSGKSTLARLLSCRLGGIYLDTGGMYRAATWKILSSGIDEHDERSVSDVLEKTEISVGENSRFFVDGREVTDLIRTRDVDRAVSHVAGYPSVRNMMVKKQRRIAENNSVVVEGRDIGSVVFTDADVKFFLTADIGERAKRRREELKQKGVDSSQEEIVSEIRARDRIDSTRKASPLVKPDGAIEIDSTRHDIDGVLTIMLEAVDKKLGLKD